MNLLSCLCDCFSDSDWKYIARTICLPGMVQNVEEGLAGGVGVPNRHGWYVQRLGHQVAEHVLNPVFRGEVVEVCVPEFVSHCESGVGHATRHLTESPLISHRGDLVVDLAPADSFRMNWPSGGALAPVTE